MNMNDNFEKKLFRMAKQETIKVPEKLDMDLELILDDIQKTKRRPHMKWKAAIVLAAVLVMTFSITATAAVSLIRQRMESINQKKLEDYFTGIQNSNLGADYRNRPYTATEEKRMEELKNAYEKEGTFPQGELTLIEDKSEYKGKGVAFLSKNNTFFLPKNEMTDEELLQIIDFYYKRDFSLQKINEKVAVGEMKLPAVEKKQKPATKDTVLNSDAVYEPKRELVIPYKGNLELTNIAAGKNCIFLSGWDGIHKMEIGSGESEMFFNDFGDDDVRIDSMYQANDGLLYIGVRKYDKNNHQKVLEVWKIDQNGTLQQKIDVSKISKANIIRQLVVDDKGYIYLHLGFSDDGLPIVMDRQGKKIAAIEDDRYTAHTAAGLCVGKDGKVYMNIRDNKSTGIASLNVEKGSLDQVYLGIINTPEAYQMPIDVIRPGIDTDFIFWGFDGIFTYNLGDKQATRILAPYDAPCQWEGVRCTILADGRVVFAASTEVKEIKLEDGTSQFRRIPESTTFYYVPTVK